jgi:transposase
MTRQRKKYTAEFKQEAVGLVTEHGYNPTEAGRSLGINGNMVRRWQRELEAEVTAGRAFPGNGKLNPDQQRIKELEAQVKRLEIEKAILKKATVFFAKESP